ncbi:MAG TPA: ATP-binding protein [Dehalococcoidia bacterium]|nr:ATP-binding protein [Dehalococcoidia bacterium]
MGDHRGRRLLRLGRLVFEPGVSLFLTLGIVIVIVVLMTATTVIDVQSRRSDVKQGMRQTGQDFAAIANGVLPDALISGDLNEMGQFASALWAQRDTSYVIVFDREGRQLVGPGEDQFPQGVVNTSVLRQVANLRTDLRWTEEGLEVTAPVTSGAQLIGAVQFGFDKMRSDDEIRELTLNRIWQTLFLVVLGVLGSFVLANYFVAPIRLLVGATERIGTGDLTTRVEQLRGREMRDLGSSFNSMAAQIQELVSALQESRSRIVSSQERLQREIAGHLHGPVQGRLLALRAQIDEVTRRQGMSDEAAIILRSIVDQMGAVIQADIATLSRRLYPAIVRRGLTVALQSLGDQFDSSLNLELRFPPDLASIERSNRNFVPERIRLAAYRIANEALTNAVKYAGDSHVLLEVDGPEEGWLTIRIGDDGPGFEVQEVLLGLGLSVMRDYAEAVGGTCDITSGLGQGTTITARLPMTEAPELPDSADGASGL